MALPARTDAVANHGDALRGRYDATLFAASAVLIVLGTLFVFSATVRTGLIDAYDNDQFHFLKQHVIHVCVGFVLFFLALKVPMRLWSKVWPCVLPLAISLLALVYFIGEDRNGARRWIRIMGITLQPSEFVKVGFALYLAGYVAKRGYLMNSMVLGILPLALMFVLVAGLLAIQPDLGSVVILGAIVVMLLIAGGMKVSKLGLLFALLVAGVVVLIIFSPEKMSRIVGWMMPAETRLGEGFHIYNSQIVIGSGGLLGAGLGRGMNHVLGYLPEAETDFLFAVASEEMGFAGVVCIVILYVAIALRGFAIVRICTDDFRRFLAFGLTILLTLPAMVHMMVGLGITPTKGLVLPLMSHGGSAMLAAMFSLGLLQRIYLEATANQERHGVGR